MELTGQSNKDKNNTQRKNLRALQRHLNLGMKNHLTLELNSESLSKKGKKKGQSQQRDQDTKQM